LKAADTASNESKSVQGRLFRDLRTAQEEITSKEMQLAAVKGDLEWANEKVFRLEEALQSATLEITRRSDECSKWEYKAGEQQQYLSELERIRKALVSQLHMVRRDLRPKEEKLAVISQDLADGEREYASALEALSEKKREISFQDEKVHLLQKQNRDLRSKLFLKETTINRAASLFAEYKVALQRAFFDRRKVTVLTPGSTSAAALSGLMEAATMAPDLPSADQAVQSGIVEVFAKDKNMEAALARLEKVLGSQTLSGSKSVEVSIKYDMSSYFGSFSALYFLDLLQQDVGDDDDTAEIIVSEQKRQMMNMQKTMDMLRESTDHTQDAAANKVHSHIRDNRGLLEEINRLRQRVTSIVYVDFQGIFYRINFPFPTNILGQRTI
jgi:hypothetical protein